MTEQAQQRPDGMAPNSVVWRRSSFSATGECVEVAAGSTWTGMRDSKNPEAPPLLFPRDTMQSFLHGVKAGEFDL